MRTVPVETASLLDAPPPDQPQNSNHKQASAPSNTDNANTSMGASVLYGARRAAARFGSCNVFTAYNPNETEGTIRHFAIDECSVGPAVTGTVPGNLLLRFDFAVARAILGLVPSNSHLVAREVPH